MQSGSDCLRSEKVSRLCLPSFSILQATIDDDLPELESAVRSLVSLVDDAHQP